MNTLFLVILYAMGVFSALIVGSFAVYTFKAMRNRK